MKRESWDSSIGFILATAGSAVGIGNIWRFPTIAGREGGGVFVILFLISILFIGIPAMIGELTLGRYAQKNAVGAFLKIKPKSVWWIAGGIGILSGIVILSFYSVIAGWSMTYIGYMFSGQLSGMDAEGLENIYEAYVSHPFLPLLSHIMFMGITTIVVTLGIKDGIEKWAKILMPGIVIILVILLIRSLTLPRAFTGVLWFITPDWTKFTYNTVLLALGQVFFSFSLGMGAILTYGSYLSRDENIPGSALKICGTDAVIAIIAGLTIIPAVFSFGLEPETGPGLVFITLPAVFNTLPAGQLFGVAFFIMFTFAALTSSVALLEVPVAYFVDQLKWSRIRASIFVGTAILLLGIPSALSQSILQDFLVTGRNFLDLMDLFASNVLLPSGAFLTAIFLGWVWGTSHAVKEINKEPNKFKLANTWSLIIKYVLPVAILIIMISAFIE